MYGFLSSYFNLKNLKLVKFKILYWYYFFCMFGFYDILIFKQVISIFIFLKLT